MANTIKSITNVVLLWALLALSGCNYERTKTMNVEPPKTWFASLQMRVFQPKCIGCHNPQKQSGNFDATSYESIMQSNKVLKGKGEHSPLFLALKAERMPPGPDKVSPAELKAICDWIDAGCSATAPTPTTPAPPPPVEPPPVLEPKYSSIRKLIIEARCIGCHSGPKPKGDLNLSTYRSMMSSSGVVSPGEPIDSSLLQRILSDTDPMPPKPRPSVTEAEVNTIEAWIKNGALEN